MNDSHIQTHADGGVTFVGRDAVDLYRALTLWSALKLYARCGMIPTRGFTITKMLAAATGYTGKKYKRGDAMKAADDVKLWADTFKASLPVVAEPRAPARGPLS